MSEEDDETNVSEKEEKTTKCEYEGEEEPDSEGEIEREEEADKKDEGLEDSLLDILLNSDGNRESIFTSWEAGIHGQSYFITTKYNSKRAEGWLDLTMNHLLHRFGIFKCVSIFRAKNEEIPREESKVRPDSFIMDYIQMLNIGEI